MDPLSLVSGIVGTAAFGFKILAILRELVEGVKSAPEELKLLTLEVEDICRVMDNFRKKAKGQISDEGIERSSRAIVDTFAQLKQLLTEYAVCEEDGLLRKGWKQIKWHCIEKDITKLREHLNSNKSNLLVALALANEARLRNCCSEVSYPKPAETGAPRAEPLAGSPKSATGSSKLTPLVGPEPGEGDGVHSGENNSEPKEAAASQSFTEILSEKERLKPRGLFRSARHRLENFRKPRSKVKESEGGEAVRKLRDATLAVALNAPPLRVLACEPVTRESHKFAMERLLRVLKASSNLAPGNLFGGLGGIQKPLKGKTYATCNFIVPVSLSLGMYSQMTRSSWKQPTRIHCQKMIPSSSRPTDVPHQLAILTESGLAAKAIPKV